MMKDFLKDYRKKWWLLSFVMGSTGGSVSYLFHGWLLFPDLYSRMSWSLFLFESLMLVLTVLVMTSLIYTPFFLLTDYLFKKSQKAIYVAGLVLSSLLPTLYLLKWRGSISSFVGWNLYVYFIITGVLCAYGWSRSRNSQKLSSKKRLTNVMTGK